MEKYISVKDFEDAALAALPKTVRDYYKSGATDEYTLAENRRAFQRCSPIIITYVVYVIKSES